MPATLKQVPDLDKDLVEDLNLPVSARIANLLERAILEGRYRPGERLREVELANRLGVSRTPLREAFYALETRGLIQIQPRRGAFVKSVTIEEMEELLTVRVSLDGLAAFLAAENAEAADIEELKKVHKSQRHAFRKRDDSAFHALGQEFHNLIYAASGSPKLITIFAAGLQRQYPGWRTVSRGAISCMVSGESARDRSPMAPTSFWLLSIPANTTCTRN